MDPTVHDHFSAVAHTYARFRPTYPAELFTWLADQSPGRRLAWDCGCGSGQASLGLAEVFESVVATDASADQLADAATHPRIEYRQAPAHRSGLEGSSVDLVAVAQALHWFDLPSFLDEAHRVLVPDGILAIWAYANPRMVDPEIDEVLQDFYSGVVGPYWPPERALVDDGYRDVELPFDDLDHPPLTMSARWTLEQALGYVSSWSATARCTAATGHSPIPDLAARLQPLWGPGPTRDARWDLVLRAGTW
jgi:ubiquinone/menaquinone biosynthesis C-methylase UbiE